MKKPEPRLKAETQEILTRLLDFAAARRLSTDDMTLILSRCLLGIEDMKKKPALTKEVNQFLTTGK